MSTGKTPRWESELWSYVSKGDGKHCPLRSDCGIRQRGGWCADDNRKHLDRLDDARQFKLSDYNFIQCGSCGKIFGMVEAVAQSFLIRGGVDCPPVPDELISLFDERRSLEVRLIPMTNYHGAIWRLKDRWIVQLNEKDSPTVRRFSLFHEAFHILAHRKTSPVFRKRGTSRGSFNELLATYFSACILTPNKWLKEKWAEVHDLDKMAELFDVPKPTMCIRLKRLGLI